MTAAAITDFDLHLFGEGNHQRIYDKLGAHPQRGGRTATRFAVWAPNAERVSVVGDFNRWDGDVHIMQTRGSSGVWELSVAEIGPGTPYKYEIRGRDGRLFLKADPYGFAMQLRPDNCSVVTELDGFQWRDDAWLHRRSGADPLRSPFNAYGPSRVMAAALESAGPAVHELARGGGAVDPLCAGFGLHASGAHGRG